MLFFLIILLIIIQSNEGDDERSWLHFYGNPSNTRRIVPSFSTNFTGNSWLYRYMSSAQDIAIQGTATGINGDLYLFVSLNRNNKADNLLCITSNGFIRWEIHIESIDGMFNSAVSNIVTNNDGIIFFISSWANFTSSIGKICRINNSQTNQPIQQCSQIDQIFQDKQNLLTINLNSTFLLTTTTSQLLMIINITNFEIISIIKNIQGSDSYSIYNCDSNGIYWIDFSNYFNKINYQNKILLNEQINSNENRYYSFNQENQLIFYGWINKTATESFNTISAWNIKSKQDFHSIWQWKQLKFYSKEYSQTVIDYIKKIIYMITLPYFIALDFNGNLIFNIQIISQEQIQQYNLISNCLSLNIQTQIAYIPIFTYLFEQGQRPTVLFLIAFDVKNMKILKQISIDVPSNEYITVHCPILVGNDLIYLTCLIGIYPISVPLFIYGTAQISEIESKLSQTIESI